MPGLGGSEPNRELAVSGSEFLRKLASMVLSFSSELAESEIVAPCGELIGKGESRVDVVVTWPSLIGSEQ